MSKDMDEKHKLAHKVIVVVNQATRKIFMTLLRYNVEKQESSSAQIRLLAKNKEEEKFQKIAYVNYEIEQLISPFDVMISVYDKNIANQQLGIFLQKVIAPIYSSTFFFLFQLGRVGTLDKREASF